MSQNLTILLLGILFGLGAMYYLSSSNKRRKTKRILSRAKKSEQEAERLLEQKGYRVLDTQVSRTFQFYQDGESINATVRADIIVEKNRKKYLAEVKTGKQADIHLANVRRQLYEYQHVFDTDGILFIDMNTKTISTITFPDEDLSKSGGPAFVFGILLGCFIMICLDLFIG